jgi:phosphoribosylaminoimidazole-succinocarboxamide synthase
MSKREKLIPFHEGKVGNLYDLEKYPGLMLLQRTSRMSGLNAKILNEMPTKGMILNQLSQWWLKGLLKDIVANHLVDIPKDFFIENGLDEYALDSSVVKKLTPIPCESIVRNYLFGSGVTPYKKIGMICGVELPEGLESGDKLPEPIFTPTEKTATDDHFTFDEMSDLVGFEIAERIRYISLEINKVASNYLQRQGIILVDMKLEFGFDEDGNLCLMDEVITPDSCRFWDLIAYHHEGKIRSKDKQKARDRLGQMKDSGEWDGKSDIALPDDLVLEISKDYEEIFFDITGEKPVLSL